MSSILVFTTVWSYSLMSPDERIGTCFYWFL